MKKILLTLSLCLLSLAKADAVNIASGNLWRVSEAASQNAIAANIPATAPDVTFDVNTPFNFNATSATIGDWLASSGAFNLVENTAGALSALMDNGIQGTIVEFTGFVSVVNGQTFTVTHDDGLTLIIGGLDLGFNPGPTAPITSLATYTGPTGTFPFQLIYGECCGGPAVLQVDLPLQTSIPDVGSTAALLGLGIASLVYARRRVRA